MTAVEWLWEIAYNRELTVLDWKQAKEMAIGSAERSCDVDTMKEMFYTIENGGYANKLFELFGKERVEAELEEFLKFDFFPRFGGGIGMTRMARAYELMKQEQLELV